MSSNNTSEELLAKTIGSVCKSCFDTNLAEWINCHVKSDNFLMIAYFPSGKPRMLSSHANHPEVFANIHTIYMAGAYLLDPFHDLHIAQAPKGAYRLGEIAPDQFQRNQYFIEYYQNTTLIDELAFVCYPNPGVSIHLCLGKDSSSGTKFTAKLVTAAKQIAPIVTALVEAHWSDLTYSGEYEETETTALLIDAALDRYGISLSPRQAQVAMLVLRGHSSVSIGLVLGISMQTVKVFRKQLYKKCKISSQAQLFNLLLPLLSR